MRPSPWCGASERGSVVRIGNVQVDKDAHAVTQPVDLGQLGDLVAGAGHHAVVGGDEQGGAAGEPLGDAFDLVVGRRHRLAPLLAVGTEDVSGPVDVGVVGVDERRATAAGGGDGRLEGARETDGLDARPATQSRPREPRVGEVRVDHHGDPRPASLGTLQEMQEDAELWTIAQAAQGVFVVPHFGQAAAGVGQSVVDPAPG